MILSFILAAVMILADQGIKLLVVQNLKPIGQFPIWEGVLHLFYTENTGAAFSMMENMQPILIITSSVASIVIIGIIIMRRNVKSMTQFISMGLILGGAIGNLIDRIRLGYVIDYVYVKIINFAVFNWADACVSVGAVLLFWYLFFIEGKKEGKKSPVEVEHVTDRDTQG